MKIRDVILKASAAAFLLVGANTAIAKGKPSDLTIVDTAVALSGTPNEFDTNGEDFDILVAAVIATGLNITVLNGEYDYTVFAPTDEAFLDFCETDVEQDCFNALAPLGPTLVAVLAYHVTEGVRNSNAVTKARKIKMLDGNTINGRGGFVEAIGSDADYEDTDIRVKDGMIHVIDTVLLPFVPAP